MPVVLSFLSALVTIFRPVLIGAAVAIWEKYHSDPEFAKGLDEAVGFVKAAKTEEDMQNAAKKYQDALFR